jgi:hypothetical protein
LACLLVSRWLDTGEIGIRYDDKRVQQGRELAHDTTFSISTSLDVDTKDLNMTNYATVSLDLKLRPS